MTETRTSAGAHALALLRPALPAAVIGVASSVALMVLSELARHLQNLLFDDIPDALDVSGGSAAWIFLVLSMTGVAVGLVVWLVPGHAGPDPATQSLVSPPLAMAVLPSLALAIIFGLAGGVSLGPENPIMAINVTLAIWIGSRMAAGAPAQQWLIFAVSGTVGAMFGTPVAAALLISELPAGPNDPRPLWDRMFAPLVAAGAGSLTTVLVAQPTFAVEVAPYPGARLVDLLSGSIVGVAAALVALVAVYAFPYVHAAFGRLTHPLVMLTAGGIVLAALAAMGGTITMFKGLDEMKELTANLSDYSNPRLLAIVAIKLAALVVAGSAGFRGGRIFPMVFTSVAFGALVSGVVSSVPISLAVAASVLGMLLAETRDGWLSLFMAIGVIGDLRLLPILCVVLLPVWLLVSGRREMVIEPEHANPAAAGLVGRR
jgi:H+/Cl- antiporter ClcA